MAYHSITVQARRMIGSKRHTYDVKLDLQTISPLFARRQEEAAAFLGLSLTSLKAACRKLGIFRWPYTRPGYVSHGSNLAFVQHVATSHVAGEFLEPSNTSSSISSPESATVSLTPNDDADSIEVSASEGDGGYDMEADCVSDGLLDNKWLSWYVNCDENSPVTMEEDESPTSNMRSCAVN